MEIKSPHANMANDQQRKVLQTLLILTFLPGMMFSILNFYRGLHLFAIIELLMAFGALIFYFKTRQKIKFHFFRNLSYMFLFCFFIASACAIWFDSSVTSIIVWVMLTPLLCYFILGRKLGTIMTILVSSVLIAIFAYQSTSVFETNFDSALFLSNIVFCLVAIWFLVHAYAQGGIYHHKKLSKMAMEDQLTGLYNRTVLQSCFEQHKNESNLSMTIIDIDWFKNINDSYGHDIGDIALIHFSRLLTKQFSKDGYIIRLGGEEFAVLLPKMQINQAFDLTQDFLDLINQTPVQSDKGQFTMSFSAGIAQYPHEASDFLSLQKLADRRLYNAKNNGRNRICRWYQITSQNADDIQDLHNKPHT